MGYAGIYECFGRNDKWFTGVVTTNGAGSPRAGIYANYTDEEMQKIRRIEQKKSCGSRRIFSCNFFRLFKQ